MLNKMSRRLVIRALVVVLFAAYAAQIYSPLRLAGDTSVYLCDATDLSEGRGFRDDHLPPGYPRVLAVMDLMGLGSSGGFVAFNLICMGAGLVCMSTILRRDFGLSKRETNTICLLSCLSWMWVQLVTFPLSDLLFFALSSMVLAMLSLSKERSPLQAALYVAAAAVLATAAFFVRTIGAALFVAVALAVLQMNGVRSFVGRRAAVILLSIGVGGAACLGFALRDRIASPWYAGALSYLTRMRNPLNTTQEIALWRIGEVGELLQNVSSTAFAPTTPTLPIESISPSVLVTLQLRAVRLAVGSVAVALVLAGLWRRRREFSPVEAYLLAYVGILLIWPFDDTRFFAPVLPLLFAFAWLGLRSLKLQPLNLRRFAVSYCVVFCLFGAVAFGDSLRVTYFDRQRPWRECSDWLSNFPSWLTAFDRYGGVRPRTIHGSLSPEQVVPR